MSSGTYQLLLSPSSINFYNCSSGTFIHDEATEQSYRINIVDKDILLIEFEYTTKHDTIDRDKKPLLSRDWKQNLDFFPKKVYMYDTDILVHRGFFQNWISIRNKILDEIYNNPDIKYIVIRGFSQGASITVLAYQDILYHINRDLKDRNIRLGGTAYEPAKVFYGKKTEFHNFPTLNLVLTRNDPICIIPPFAHHYAGKIIKIGKWYRFFPIQHYPDQVAKALDEEIVIEYEY
jgi:hypothetical protein